MLSTRYLHLHEALGLGPMWLKRDAKIIAGNPAEPGATQPQTAEPVTVHTPIPQPAPAPPAGPTQTASAKPVPTVAISGGHAATLAALGLKTLRQRELEASAQEHEHAAEAPQTDTAPDPGNTVEQHKHRLTDKIPPARIMVISICPSPEDSLNGTLFSGQVGELLHNMLSAIDLQPHESHKTSWLDSAEFDPAPAQNKLIQALPRLRAELELADPAAVLFLGQFFEAPEQSTIMHELCGNLPAFTLPHPARLLRQPQQKAQAWAVLKQLRRYLRNPQTATAKP